MNSKLVIGCVVGIVLASAGVISLREYGDTGLPNRGNSPSLRLGTNVWSGYEPFYLARSLGHYDDNSIRLVECSSASQVIRAFRNNAIELAALTLDEVLLLREQGHDVRVILVTDISDGGDVVLSKPDTAQLGDLRGRAVGVESTAVGAYVLTRALQSAGMSVSDVTAVPLEVSEHERAFVAGEVDAVVTFEPVRRRLLATGAVQLFDSSEMPMEIVDVLAVRKSVLESNPDKVNVLLRGWFAARDYLLEHPEDAGKRMSDRSKLAPHDALATFEGIRLPSRDENLALLSGMDPKLAEAAGRVTEFMLEQNLLRKDVDISELFSAEPLQNLGEVSSY